MKKVYITIFCALLVLVGCTSTADTYYKKTYEKELIEPKTSITVDGEDVVELSVTPAYNGTDSALYDKTAVNGIGLTVKNKTADIVRVVWEGCSFFYNNTSYPAFIEGQKYIDANKPMPDSIIPPGSTFNKDIFTSEGVHYNKGSKYISGYWSSSLLPSNFVFIVCIEHKGNYSYYSINFDTDVYTINTDPFQNVNTKNMKDITIDLTTVKYRKTLEDNIVIYNDSDSDIGPLMLSVVDNSVTEEYLHTEIIKPGKYFKLGMKKDKPIKNYDTIILFYQENNGQTVYIKEVKAYRDDLRIYLSCN